MEQKPNHWMAAVGVIAAGFASAMLFHDGGAPPSPASMPASTPQDATDLQWMGEPVTLHVSGDPSSESQGASPVGRPGDAPPRPRTKLSRTPDAHAPPEIEREYGGLLDQFGRNGNSDVSNWPAPARPGDTTRLSIPTGEIKPVKADLGDSPPDERPKVPATAQATRGPNRITDRINGPSRDAPVASDSPAPVRPPRTSDRTVGESIEPTVKRKHIVRDGDTLVRLAQRYYGDEAWSARIYAANRDQLSDPDLLPVGTPLNLPDEAQSLGEQPLAPLVGPPTLSATPSSGPTNPTGGNATSTNPKESGNGATTVHSSDSDVPSTAGSRTPKTKLAPLGT